MDRIKARGSSMVEFVIVAPLLAGLGLGTVQAGLVYHGKSILNYATFEAARTGAVNHALLEPMRRELGTRLAPIQGGDGTAQRAQEAIVRAQAEVLGLDDAFTHIEVLNPTREAFDHFKVRSRESGIDVIPNSHLRHQSREIDPVSGVNLQDANLLKIRVTYGFDLKVPLVSDLLGAIMRQVDPAHTHYYEAGKLPLTSVATVRMQSEVHGDSLRALGSPALAARPDVDNTPLVSSGATLVPPDNQEVAAPPNLLSEANLGESAADCTTAPGHDPFLPTIDENVCAIPPTNASPVVFDETSTQLLGC